MRWNMTSAVLVLSLGCATAGTTRPAAESSASTDLRCMAYDNDPDAQFPEDWYEELPDDDEPISREAASRFVDHAFDVVDSKFYDPTAFDAERTQARLSALKALTTGDEPTRENTATIVKRAFRSIGVSHLHLLMPENARALDDRVESSDEARVQVAARMDGDVGILEVKSFLVPEISHEGVQEALRTLRPAKSILIDLRGNGGGSISPVIYLAQYFVGPDRVLVSNRDRCHVQSDKPYVQHGFFSDDVNAGSAADVSLHDERGYVQWRTPIDAAPADPRPVFLLVDRHCGSACEVFTSAMQEHDAASILGENTAGKVLAGLGYMSSWKGYLLIVPTATILSPSGGSVEGDGVSPDVPITACRQTSSDSEQDADENRCLQAALEVVRDNARNSL